MKELLLAALGGQFVRFVENHPRMLTIPKLGVRSAQRKQVRRRRVVFRRQRFQKVCHRIGEAILLQVDVADVGSVPAVARIDAISSLTVLKSRLVPGSGETLEPFG